MMIRTRFAPSPTGELHIGGARTALFNYLYARSFGEEGRFVLRIDDTDSERSRRGYEAALLADLRWLGLDWDEGPDKPASVAYRQSERGGIYTRWMDRLRELGAVYPCFCPEERLSAMREEQLSRGEPPRYDGHCRSLSRDEVQRRVDEGERPCWRLALPENYAAAFDDAVRGHQSFPAGTIGDFVVERNDGTPTYLFASAVDDYLMGITHVIRGDEHIPNTARQLAIIDLMGWPRPVFAHIPMVLSPGKRTGSTPVREYRERGFLPEALTAYLATLSWTPGATADPFDLRSLAKDFSIEKIVSSSPVHDEGHLLHWQKEAMARRGGGLADELAALEPRLALLRERLAPLAGDVAKEVPFMKEVIASLSFLTERPAAVREPWMADLIPVLEGLSPWNAENIEKALRAFMKERGMKGRDFFHPLRLALTGLDRGSPLPLVLFALGREECAARLG